MGKRIRIRIGVVPLSAVLTALAFTISLFSCSKLKDADSDPEIETLVHGIKTSSLVEYCASLAVCYFNGGAMPGNVVIQSKKNILQPETVLMTVAIDNSYPLPFNSSKGQLAIAGIWNETGGVLSVLFTDIDIIERKYQFKGLYTIPIIDKGSGKYMTLFAEQDIVIGEGSDTLLHLNMGTGEINLELERLASDLFTDPFVAVQQNVWFITFDPNNTLSDVYDDEFTINGGGQVVEVVSLSGGLMYHAMIDAKLDYAQCALNPLSGVGFIQNLKAGRTIDLGHVFLDFHKTCDGTATVAFAFGKYLMSNHKDIELKW
jgi:hypothetical protein